MSEKLFGFALASSGSDSPSEAKEQLVSFADIPPTAQFLTLPETSEPSVRFVDMDRDGDLDIVIPSSSGQPEWIENTLGPVADSIFNNRVFSRITPTVMAIGDINGDGTDDVVIGHISGAKIFYQYEGWAMQDLGTVLNNPRSIAIEDIDSDGNTDILIRDSQELILFENHDGQLGAQSLTWPDLGDNSLLGVANFNQTTQAKEILVYQTSTRSIGVVAHNGHSWQSFQAIKEIGFGRVVIADINNDGIDDVYVEDGNGNSVVMESNDQGELVLTSGTTLMNTSSTHNYDIAVDDSDDTSCCKQPVSTPKEVERLDTSPPPPTSSKPTTVEHDTPTAKEADLPIEEPSEGSEETPVPTAVKENIPIEHVEHEDPVVKIIGTQYGDFIDGDANNNFIEGLDGNDIIWAAGGDDTLLGGDGSDIIIAGSGDDFLKGQNGNDILMGEAGNDNIHAGSGDDVLFGDGGNDFLAGGKGNDVIFGNQGDDILKGGKGCDFLLGGTGNDTFLYNSIQQGDDVILGFEKGSDSFSFEFGSHQLHNTDDIPQDAEGDSFLWESTGDGFGTLSYDPNLNVHGDETMIAIVELTDDADITIDDITII